MIYVIFVIFGLLPSIIWLLFYLRKDVHPESNKMILKVFFFGMLAAVLAAVIEMELFGAFVFLGGGYTKTFLFFLFSEFIIIALVEETSKFLFVKEKVVNHWEFDEPVDAMIYMIIVALGFAALENTLVLFSNSGDYIISSVIQEAALISSFRFLGATFLHALASGTIGYFLALSFFKPAKRLELILKGLIIATLLHGLFNISIMVIESGAREDNMIKFVSSFAFIIVLLSGLAFFVSRGFRKLKKLKSVCNFKQPSSR